MANWTKLEVLVPKLRRHARNLVADINHADYCVELALEILLAEPERLGRNANVATVLFKAFHDAWMRDNDPPRPQYMSEGIRLALLRLPPGEREVLSLTHTDFLNEGDCAEIMGCRRDTIQAAKRAAVKNLATAARKRALVIDDDTEVGEHLIGVARDCGYPQAHRIASNSDIDGITIENLPTLILAAPVVKRLDDTLSAFEGLQSWWQAPAIFATDRPDMLSSLQEKGRSVIVRPFDTEATKSAIASVLNPAT